MSQPTTQTSSPRSIDDLTEFLFEKKGTLEIITEIGRKGPRRHIELQDELVLSVATLQKRLNAGKHHDLWQIAIERRGSVDAKVYGLTPMGEEVFVQTEELGLPRLYETRRRLIHTIEQREQRLFEKKPLTTVGFQATD